MSTGNINVDIIVKTLDLKKATDIKVLDVRNLTTLTDYFVIATGNSNKQVQALSDHVEEEMAKIGKHIVNREGYNFAEWILIGYEDVIVHIFQEEIREFYALEHIWKDAPNVDIDELIIES